MIETITLNERTQNIVSEMQDCKKRMKDLRAKIVECVHTKNNGQMCHHCKTNGLCAYCYYYNENSKKMHTLQVRLGDAIYKIINEPTNN